MMKIINSLHDELMLFKITRARSEVVCICYDKHFYMYFFNFYLSVHDIWLFWDLWTIFWQYPHSGKKFIVSNKEKYSLPTLLVCPKTYGMVVVFGACARTSETTKKHCSTPIAKISPWTFLNSFKGIPAKSHRRRYPWFQEYWKCPQDPATGSAETPQKPRLVPVQGPAQDPPSPLLTRSAGVVPSARKCIFWFVT